MTNKNKESNLIKKIWNGIDFLVPGSLFFRFGNWIDNSKSRTYLKGITNIAITSGLLGMGFLYVTNALKYQALNYKKWPEIRKKIQMRYSYEEQINDQRVYRNQFQTLNKNKDDVLDSTEFIYRNE